MTRIRATCPMCGEVDLRPHDIELELARAQDVAAPEEVAEGSCYRFSCPTCTETITKPADQRIARLLRTGGVAVVEPPSPPVHPETPPAGPPLTHDDLLDLHQLLDRTDWFHELEVLTR